MGREQHIEAEVTLLPTFEGGRGSYVVSGYRPQFHYRDTDWDAELTFEVERVQPGDTVRALVSFMSPAAHRGLLAEGTQFELWEGPRVVGKGRVTKVIAL